MLYRGSDAIGSNVSLKTVCTFTSNSNRVKRKQEETEDRQNKNVSMHTHPIAKDVFSFPHIHTNIGKYIRVYVLLLVSAFH